VINAALAPGFPVVAWLQMGSRDALGCDGVNGCDVAWNETAQLARANCDIPGVCSKRDALVVPGERARAACGWLARCSVLVEPDSQGADVSIGSQLGEPKSRRAGFAQYKSSSPNVFRYQRAVPSSPTAVSTPEA
jgi:hypothetical protein